MIVSVASGKGGTGKTTVATSLALSSKSAGQFLDCDVEEPNAHLFLKPHFRSGKSCTVLIPSVDESLCTYCGKCQEVCAYNAVAVIKKEDSPGSGLSKVIIFPELCHSCGGCKLLCPHNAIRELPRPIGVIEEGVCGHTEFIHGMLNIGEAMSPPLIREVKSYIKEDTDVVIDAPPGNSCPVVETVKGCDYCVLVTEPTPFGMHDLEIAAGVLKKMSIPRGVVINKSRYGRGESSQDKVVEDFCEKEGIDILERIPFKREIAEMYSKGIPLSTGLPGYEKRFNGVFEKIRKRVNEK
jgi:MinD superfamily P-loop ATPase